MGDRRKQYVKVQAEFDTGGNILPTAILWTDGTRYEIDKVVDHQRRASLKAGGTGIRYHIRVVWDTSEGEPARAESYLFMEDDGKWFVEAKE